MSSTKSHNLSISRYKFKLEAKHLLALSTRVADHSCLLSLHLFNFSSSHQLLHKTMSLLVKIPLLVVATLGAWYALTPPQPPPDAQERVKSGGIERSFGSVVRVHAFLWKVCLISQALTSRD